MHHLLLFIIPFLTFCSEKSALSTSRHTLSEEERKEFELTPEIIAAWEKEKHRRAQVPLSRTVKKEENNSNNMEINPVCDDSSNQPVKITKQKSSRRLRPTQTSSKVHPSIAPQSSNQRVIESNPILHMQKKSDQETLQKHFEKRQAEVEKLRKSQELPEEMWTIPEEKSETPSKSTDLRNFQVYEAQKGQSVEIVNTTSCCWWPRLRGKNKS